jgi:SAM-dependent methyltransferase
METLEYKYNITVWNQSERISNSYDWLEHYLTQDYDKDFGKDYTDGIFNNNYNISMIEAMKNKFDMCFKELNLKEGHTLLDCGCGTGIWMLYCKNRGVNTIGITLSEEQAKIVRSKGLECIVQDYRILNKNLIGKFDAVSLIGSTEHNCSSQGAKENIINCENRCNDTRTKIFLLLNSYLKPQGHMIIQSIVDNKVDNYKTIKDSIIKYFLERHYGGFYSYLNHYKKSLEDANFNVIKIKDNTNDYFYSSVADPDHFGYFNVNFSENTMDKILYFIRGLLLDPFLLHHWGYQITDAWMWQFGGYKNRPLTQQEINDAPCNSVYFILQHK